MAKNTKGIRILTRLIDAGYDTEKAIASMTLDDIIALEISNKNDMATLNELIKSVKANRVVTFLASGSEPEQKGTASQNLTTDKGEENHEENQSINPHDPVC
ncbi:hypothetical protein EUCA11A_35120 [Eubacterium callanderi]|uniref:hypothetical protein n=1 Tax=Eubacterium callanderi TaxID=53442 RepID=UPI0029FF2D72|nr:hypothetical protein [Eubacterium callanderi]WPK69324.1 hypothetical protein EUCA2A_35120 [Eubacterium callanderi]WPK73622.1 hypothetical protein EUCA11A_35120 [Eubacterium callanderi]